MGGDLLLGLIGILSIVAVAAIYPLKLDKRLPYLTFLQVLLLLFIAQALDFMTFVVATGGKPATEELNPIYQSLLKVLSRGDAAIFSQKLIMVLLVCTVLACFRRWGSRRGVLTWTIALTSFSLVAVYFNVVNGILS